MDLYDVKVRGLHSPLNAREIAQLVRTGRFDPRSPCKPTGEARWRTVDELFPLLRYQGEAFALILQNQKPARSARRFLSHVVLTAVILGSLALFWWARPPSSDQAQPTAPLRSTDTRTAQR